MPGQYVDGYLQPLVKQTRAYLRDAKHLLQQLERLKVSSDSVLVTSDVGSLYTIINHDDVQ